MSSPIPFEAPGPEETIAGYLQPVPEDIREKLLKVLGTSSASPVTNSIRSLLRDPSPSDETLAAVSDIFLALRQHSVPWLFGALGFFLFVHRAEEPGDATTPAQAYLDESEVRRFVVAEYEIPRDLPDTWKLHKAGTTSLLLRVSNGTHQALKLIKPRYFDRRDIGDDTAEYKRIFASYQGRTPTIECCGRRFILMQFIEGITLGHYLAVVNPTLKGTARLASTRNIVSKLCSILHEFHERGIKHLDLAPDNIILTEKDNLTGERPPTDFIRLIDFGPNHILREGIGSANDYEEVRSYVAPEVIKNFRSGSYLSDAYSLGRIFLQLLIANDRHAHVSHTLDQAWARQPQLASLIEELIDENPENRLLGGPRDASALAVLSDRINMELALQQHIQKELLKSGVLEVASEIPSDVSKPLKELTETIRALEAHEDTSRRDDLVRLAWHCRFTGLASAAVWAAFSFVFVGFPTWSAWREQISGYGATNRWEYLPGLVVGLSFTMLASRYYLNIFARVTTRHFDSYEPMVPLARRAEWWMRANAFLFAIPTIFGMLVDSRVWPIYCGVGVLFVAINNHIAVRLCRKASDCVHNHLVLPASAERQHFFDEFANWGRGMFLYVGVLWMVCVILVALYQVPVGDATSRFVDQCVLSAICIMLNYVLWKRNCTLRAAVVRGGLHRLFEGVGRVAKRASLDAAGVVKR